MYSSTVSLTSELNGGGWSTPRPGRFNPVERPGTHCIGGWVGPRTGYRFPKARLTFITAAKQCCYSSEWSKNNSVIMCALTLFNRLYNKETNVLTPPPYFMLLEGSSQHAQGPAICPCPEPHQSCPCPQSLSWRSLLILCPNLRLGFPSGSFPQVFPQKSCMHLSFPNTSYMPCLSHSSCCGHRNILWWVQITKLLGRQSAPLPCYLGPLRPKYPPQHPTLENIGSY